MPRGPNATYLPWNDGGAHPFSVYVEKGWALRCACWDCGHTKQISGAGLVASYGAGCTIPDLFPHLRCSACKVGKIHVWIVSELGRPGQMAPG